MAFGKLQWPLWASCFPHFSESFLKKKKHKKQIKKKKTRTFLRTMPQWKEHRPSILRPKFAKNLELGFLFCLVLFCLNQTTTSFKSFTRSNYSVPKHQTCIAHGPQGKPPQQDSHRCCHERAAGCPPPLFAAWAATGFLRPPWRSRSGRVKGRRRGA